MSTIASRNQFQRVPSNSSTGPDVRARSRIRSSERFRSERILSLIADHRSVYILRIGSWSSRKSVESLFGRVRWRSGFTLATSSTRSTSENLQELFEQYGSVSSAQVLSDRETGRSRGFGFVEMPE